MSTEIPQAKAETGEIVGEYTVSLEQVEDYEFRVKFDKEHYPEIEMDEPAPLGKDSAPSAGRMLAAAVGNCLSASLIFCSRKSKVNVEKIRTKVTVQVVRNQNRRQRIGKLMVEIEPHVPESERQKALRCMDIFEDYCVITQSVRQGIDVDVKIHGFEHS